MDGDVHLKGRPRCPLVRNSSEAKKIQGPEAIVPSLRRRRCLGPRALDERGDRRRPRCTSLAQRPMPCNRWRCAATLSPAPATGCYGMGMIRLGLALVLLCLIASRASAQFCAVYSTGTRSCGIPSREMCMQAISGVGGACELDQTSSLRPNMVQRLRAERMAPLPSAQPGRPLQIGVSGRQIPQAAPRPVRTSPCMSLSGDTCGNYIH